MSEIYPKKGMLVFMEVFRSDVIFFFNNYQNKEMKITSIRYNFDSGNLGFSVSACYEPKNAFKFWNRNGARIYHNGESIEP